ncbi:ABC transporter [Herbiconiux sp. CPCC 203407]|uniref:ABC transporter n=1 Tax=Herbiconiux oxytropis TaxID=2970915 RepID=A0AA41XGH8_9MICO|nr:ABC transporter [Herbiconiux oxytropis]MCS5722951.1 ABC transporter [Herbiconiux oxytropis]MCS5725789.1 ABC transporter [Herbiconiux oxytropis]
MLLRPTSTAAVTASLLAAGIVLSACANDAPSAEVASDPSRTSPDAGEVVGDGHGAVAGAQEVAEPPLHLLTLDPEGAVDQLDLLDESVEQVGEVGDVTGIATDGRFVFAGLAGGASVAVVDSGFWTWSHIDHFHYYRGASALLGQVDLAGTAPATVSTGGATTGLFSPTSGEAVLLDTAGLADGDLAERLRLEVEPHAGLIAGVGTGALVTRTDAAESVARESTETGSTRLTLVESGGTELDSIVCTNARDAIETVVGVAVGCDEGAALATAGGTGDSDAPSLEMIAYPAGAAAGADAAPAADFRNREGRPTVAALAGDAGTTRLWLLDTRERSWQLLDAGVPLLQATAVDDADGHVLALAADGRVLVLSARTGATLAATEPLLTESLALADPSLLAGVELVADQQRAYLNAPAEHRLFEIDFADSARVSRTFDTPSAPLHLAETGR